LDHYSTQSSFLFSPHTFPHVEKPLWRVANKAALSLGARELYLFPRCIEHCADKDTGVDR
jgi:hypothetical protein